MCDLGEQVDLGVDTLVALIAKIVCEHHINADEEGKREVFVEIFFSEEGLRCVGTTQCLLAY